MDIRVSGHQMETGEALRAHVEDRLTAMVQKHFARALSSVVTFGKAPGGSFRCDIVTHVRQGLILKGAGITHDAHTALEQAAEKVEKQLRRYKRRLNDRHEEAAYTARTDEAAYTIFVEPDVEQEEAPAEAPLVIAEMRVDVPEATVSDAVMMLDLRNTTALLFKNAGTGKHNMVYRRGDGSIGWVEPS
ncbi:ribosome-associated translation inhibitor RaiA [Novosphingobium sp. FSY-8]|uniref:Ribosome hibernation promoting factor n=1 Tax=Novosphingobium ovatum TaxID=1908523 RepID=A0ABW9XHE7_9SPHN|nr:ribosome-associated translation inhibitor RaiA [Novosphingobium ovatum]NBC37980.1 ribosome-associated translation inhibitor RaiA [Novosphingobium ovatum]